MPNRGLKTDLLTATFLSRSQKETFRLGAAFGKAALGREVIALTGDLGAGKTHFVKGLAEGLDIDAKSVSSPTYLLVHCHTGRLCLTHIDLYRLDKPGEIGAFGLEEYFEGEGVVALEWAEKGAAILPTAQLKLSIECLEGDHRAFRLEARDEQHQAWLERVQAIFQDLETMRDTKNA